MTTHPPAPPCSVGDPRLHPDHPDAARIWLTCHHPQVLRWARPHLRAAGEHRGPLPTLGSTEWAALPDSDPRKLAAALRAALAWLADTTPDSIAAQLRTELDDYATAVRRMFAAAHRELSHDARQRVLDRYATGPSHAELVRRRNTHTCRTCDTVFHGPVACPNGCDTPEQLRVHAAASWSAGTVALEHRRSA